MDTQSADTIVWLLAAKEPTVQYPTRSDLLNGNSLPDRAVMTAGPWVSALLAGQQEDGGLGDPYRKWTGVHWRLVSLAELAAPASTRAWQPPLSMSWPGSSKT